MTFEKNSNYAAEGLLKFAAPFWGKPRWAALFVASAREIQELENVFFDIIESRFLDNATGPRLAMLGRIVGQTDPGLGEATFKQLIRVRIRIRRSTGRLRDVQEVLQLLNIPRNLAPSYPAKMRLDVVDSSPLPIALLKQLIEETLAVGVGLVLVQGDEDGFAFQADSDAGTDGDFSQDNDLSVGANFTTVI
jgi:hypothetical protein